MKQCPSCGAKKMVHGTRDIDHAYKGRKTVVRKVVCDWCAACGEMLFDADAAARVSAAALAFNKQVNAAHVDPAFILAVRKKLALDQREAAALFGGGANAFSRYETGVARPPVALVKLLRVLDRHPDLLDEIRAA